MPDAPRPLDVHLASIAIRAERHADFYRSDASVCWGRPPPVRVDLGLLVAAEDMPRLLAILRGAMGIHDVYDQAARATGRSTWLPPADDAAPALPGPVIVDAELLDDG